MRMYNTLTRKVEEFVPCCEGEVKLYTCGPTVYHYAHIGNLRSYLHEDVLEKYLKYIGYKVDRVMNITDVGHLTSDGDEGSDKMVNSAKKEHKSVMDIAKFYTDKFFEDCATLNIRKPDTVVPATSLIDDYIKIISKLLDTGYAYVNGGNVYFDTSKLKEYYVLTNHKEDDLLVGVRDDVTEDENKRNKTDFVLWFTKSKFEDQELKWDSPWGVGYPGWHIECSGISLKYLGEYLDIHCGGVDNIFPHHTNEIAQSESYIGHKWCNYWFHVEHLNLGSEKMSKSKGEVLTVDTLKAKGYEPLSYRYLALSSHYQNKLEFTFENLSGAQNAYLKLRAKVLRLNREDGEVNQEMFDKYKKQFMDAMDDNFNTSMALTTVYDVLKADTNDATKFHLIEDFDRVLSLDLTKEMEKKTAENEDEILKLIAERAEAKKNKDFATADQIRNDLLEKGIRLIDTKEGTTYEII
ncbi:MAG: cysteine--tRNA ligase [Clostridia bacterium]|nr:cysteine--tRNA ligase [Clostridia bacterium]